MSDHSSSENDNAQFSGQSHFHLHNIVSTLHQQLEQIQHSIAHTLHHSKSALEQIQETHTMPSIPATNHYAVHQSGVDTQSPPQSPPQSPHLAGQQGAAQTVEQQQNIDSVIASTDHAAHNLLSNLQHSAAQHFQQIGQDLQQFQAPQDPNGSTAQASAHATDPMAAYQHQDKLLQQLQQEALDRVREAENAMYDSIAKVQHAAEGQMHAMAQQNNNSAQHLSESMQQPHDQQNSTPPSGESEN